MVGIKLGASSKENKAILQQVVAREATSGLRYQIGVQFRSILNKFGTFRKIRTKTTSKENLN